MFYDCTGTATQTFTGPAGSLPVGEVGAIVECPDNGNGLLERAALSYDDPADGATVAGTQIFNNESVATRWTPTNGWYDALSSPIDWTAMYPGWATYVGAPTVGNGDLLTLGNAGSLTIPSTGLQLATTAEAFDVDEAQEPLDGPGTTGGDRIDPLTDTNWVTTYGKTYNTTAAYTDSINVTVERVDSAEAVVNTPYTGTLTGLLAAPVSVLGGVSPLAPNEVTRLRLNWDMPSTVGNAMQGQLVDVRFTFNANN
jgi:hypothetical protein